MASKFSFNPNDIGHRKLLATAIRDFVARPGNSVGGHKKHGKRLLNELDDRGTPVTKSNIDRLKKALYSDENGDSYPRNAVSVAEYLHEENFFPPGSDASDTLKLLPVFFNGFNNMAVQRLVEIEGTYTSFQHSNLDANFIVTGNLTVGKITDWRYAPVREELLIQHNGRSKLVYEGVAFSDSKHAVYMFLREHRLRHPRFYLFDDTDRSDSGAIEILFGTILSAGRLHSSHLSPVCLYRGDLPPPKKRIRKDDMSKLPEFVARYLARPLAPGHSNGSEYD